VADVLVAMRAVLPHFHPLRMLPLVLVEEEVPVLAVGALENDLVPRHGQTLRSIVDKGDPLWVALEYAFLDRLS
jgi:hypothetical protein